MAFTRVSLREQTNKSSRHSLYLDVYPPIYDKYNGKKTRRFFLGLYIKENPESENEKKINVISRSIARIMEGKLQLELIYGGTGERTIGEIRTSGSCREWSREVVKPTAPMTMMEKMRRAAESIQF